MKSRTDCSLRVTFKLSVRLNVTRHIVRPRVTPRNGVQPREGYTVLRSVSDSVLCVWHVSGVGYTMRDIRYHWKDGHSSVGMSNEVQLPQFRVLGHRQRATVITLTTGNSLH